MCSVGDGAFQMTAQELSTILRYGTHPIIVVVNNGSYCIEVEIHDGPCECMCADVVVWGWVGKGGRG